MINILLNIIINLKNNIKILIQNIIYYPYIISYLPFFENTNGATDYYYVHIRVGWMEWVVYKYSYDIILDQYVLAYLIFLYIQFLIILPIYYLYVVKYANYISSEHPDLDQVVFFQKFNIIIDIFLFIDFVILMSFYYYWPMSALSHALFYKVLTKSLFAWAIIIFIFYYQLNLTILAIFFAGYSWRQVVVILIQFSIFNSIIYLIWSYYHDSYSVKIGVLLAFHVIHAYSLNGWNHWYTDYDFEDIWRLGPEFEGWVFWHEYLEARQIRKVKIKKIYDYEREEYLKRRKKRLEEAQQYKEYKQKLKEEGKLSWYIIFFDAIWNNIVKIYRYFAYYDKELAIKLEQEKKKKFADALQAEDFQKLILNSYFTNLPMYYKQQYDEKQMIELQKEYEEEWYNIVRKEETLNMFYETFVDIDIIESEIIKRLKQAHGMHIFYYVLDKKPMTFLEFIKSYDDNYSFVDQRRRLIIHTEKDFEVRFEEALRSYEQLLNCDFTENVSFLRLHIRYHELWNRFGIRLQKDHKNLLKWNQYHYNLIYQAYEIMALNFKSFNHIESFISIKSMQEQLRNQFDLTLEDIKNKRSEKVEKDETMDKFVEPLLIKMEDFFEDFDQKRTNDLDFFIENINSQTNNNTLRQAIINYNKMDMFQNIQYEKDWQEDFLDFYTEEEKRKQKEWEEGLKTNTFEKWKQMEEEDDYFKYTNFQKFLWWYDIELHVIGAYFFYWFLSYDKFWFAANIYGHSNLLTM